MDNLADAFDERLQEIETYLDLLDALEQQATQGPPTIGGRSITAQQQRILYSSVYLQLYNLVEATATWCVSAVVAATSEGGRWKPADLDAQLRREWVRTTARTHVHQNFENRLDEAVMFCERLLNALPIGDWKVERGGNWDDRTIEKITERIGCQLNLTNSVKAAAKRRIRNDKSSLGLVRELRNQLAHGTISFEQCAAGVTVRDLRDLKDRTANYLREVVSSFQQYLDNHLYLAPEARPTT